MAAVITIVGGAALATALLQHEVVLYWRVLNRTDRDVTWESMWHERILDEER